MFDHLADTLSTLLMEQMGHQRVNNKLTSKKLRTRWDQQMFFLFHYTSTFLKLGPADMIKGLILQPRVAETSFDCGRFLTNLPRNFLF